MNDWIPLTERKMDEEFEELNFVQPHKKMAVNLVLCEDAVNRKAVVAETYRDCTDVKSDQLNFINDNIEI